MKGHWNFQGGWEKAFKRQSFKGKHEEKLESPEEWGEGPIQNLLWEGIDNKVCSPYLCSLVLSNIVSISSSSSELSDGGSLIHLSRSSLK